MSASALKRLKNHNILHLHPNFTMFMPLNRLQLKMYAFSGKFNVCSKRVFLSWIQICRDFKLQTQIFTQNYRSWLRFYSEFLRKKLTAGGSAFHSQKRSIGAQRYPASWFILRRDQGFQICALMNKKLENAGYYNQQIVQILNSILNSYSLMKQS